MVDPLAGSYYLESLTASLAVNDARELIDEVEANSAGMTRAVEAGHAEAPHRGGGGEAPGPRRPGRGDGGRGQPLPARTEEDEVELLAIDNTAVREAQVRHASRTSVPAGATTSPAGAPSRRPHRFRGDRRGQPPRP